MSQSQLDPLSLKALIKEPVVEALEQQREMLYDAVAEALEDIAMARAIKDGDRGHFVSRDEIFSILGNPA